MKRKILLLSSALVIVITITALFHNGLFFAQEAPGEGSASGTLMDKRADELKSTVISPVLNRKISGEENILWSGAFQLAWNRLCDSNGGSVQMESAPDMVSLLNGERDFGANLDETNSVAVAGLLSEGIIDSIKSALDTKAYGQTFPGLSEDLQSKAGGDGLVVFSFLNKQIPFKYPFHRYTKAMVFNGQRVESFGLRMFSKDSERDIRKMTKQVEVLYWDNPEKFIVALKTESRNDTVILARVEPLSTLSATVDMAARLISSSKSSRMDEKDAIMIPVFNFRLAGEYSDLYNHPLQSSDGKVNGKSVVAAEQMVRFRLDDSGNGEKDEMMVLTSGASGNAKFYNINKPFLLMLKHRGANRPYFAVWVANSELLVPVK